MSLRLLPPVEPTASSTAKTVDERRRSGGVSRAVLIFASVLVLGTLVALALRGYSYYTTPLIERPRHPDYWLLKPGGAWGRAYGIAGASLLLLMLSYSLRKRWTVLRKAGSLRAWLGFHIFCGVTGALLILLHTSFKFGGLVSLSFWSMVIVAVSGLLGRYLYRQIPRARSGDELSLDQARTEEEALGRELLSLGVPPEAMEGLETIARECQPKGGGLLMLLARLPAADLRLRLALRAYGRQLWRTPPELRHQVLEVASRKARLRRRITLWRELQRLFYYWHVLHKPFALIMYLFMVVHVAVVTVTGYGLGVP